MALGADQTNNLVFIQHHHQLHIGKNVVGLIRPGHDRVGASRSASVRLLTSTRTPCSCAPAAFLAVSAYP
jgi:hypothetical protein